jgi:hypothetical protein
LSGDTEDGVDVDLIWVLLLGFAGFLWDFLEHFTNFLEVLDCFGSSTYFQAKAADFRQNERVFGEPFRALENYPVGVSIVCLSRMDSADLMAEHDVLRLMIVLSWEKSKQFMSFDINCVVDRLRLELMSSSSRLRIFPTEI